MNKQIISNIGILILVGGLIIVNKNNQSIPEFTICQQLGINLIDGLGNKIQSSSWLLNNRK